MSTPQTEALDRLRTMFHRWEEDEGERPVGAVMDAVRDLLSLDARTEPDARRVLSDRVASRGGSGSARMTTREQEIERIAAVLHDLDGTQHYITHEQGYDGDDIEGVTCATGVEGHAEDAADAHDAGLRATGEPAGTGLDVAVLREAIDNVNEMNPLDYLDDGDTTDAIAAEYARLTDTQLSGDAE